MSLTLCLTVLLALVSGQRGVAPRVPVDARLEVEVTDLPAIWAFGEGRLVYYLTREVSAGDVDEDGDSDGELLSVLDLDSGRSTLIADVGVYYSESIFFRSPPAVVAFEA